MDDIAKLLPYDKFEQPVEIEKIKNYVKEKYNYSVSVIMRERDIILSVENASLASTLRLNIVDLMETCGLSKKIIIRIG